MKRKQKKILFFATLVFVVGYFPLTSFAYVSVDGYYREDGTYVSPHVRSEPNGVRYDNYGYDGDDPYNDTYNDPSYSSDWDTPSWNTDPDYYRGESLYESNNSSSGVNSYESHGYDSSYDTYNSYNSYDHGGYDTNDNNSDSYGSEQYNTTF
ncbi:MAG: hypothetical protein ACLFNN_03300 [Candidatus Paceibacterota bacterium]